ncbi:MAG: hypothetical protein M1541_16190, partial [Acidobacteria bacterium]|nr:hypothetical protein [Acidobacteriota bacterium]
MPISALIAKPFVAAYCSPGERPFLEVLDAQRTLVSTGSQYLRALSTYHQAAAEVERLIGEPLTR